MSHPRLVRRRPHHAALLPAAACALLAACTGVTDSDPVTIAACNSSDQGSDFQVFARASRPDAPVTASLLGETASGIGTATVDAPIPPYTRAMQLHDFTCATEQSTVDGRIEQPADPEPTVAVAGELELGVEGEFDILISDAGANAGLTGDAVLELSGFDPATSSFPLSGTSQTLTVEGTASSTTVSGTLTLSDRTGAVGRDVSIAVAEGG